MEFPGNAERQRYDLGTKLLFDSNSLATLRHLGGLPNLVDCQPVTNEFALGLKIPDRVYSVRTEGSTEVGLLMVEVSASPYQDLPDQMHQAILTVGAVTGVIPDALSIILRPYATDRTQDDRVKTGSLGLTSVHCRWKIVELWKLTAEHLVQARIPELLPWILFANHEGNLEERLTIIRDEAVRLVPQPEPLRNLLTITALLARVEAGDVGLRILFNSSMTWEVLMKDSAFKDTIGEWLAAAEAKGEARGKVWGARRMILVTLARHFGPPTDELTQSLDRVQDFETLCRLQEVAVFSQNLGEFQARLRAELESTIG